jgi:hypothetical protein
MSEKILLGIFQSLADLLKVKLHMLRSDSIDIDFYAHRIHKTIEDLQRALLDLEKVDDIKKLVVAERRIRNSVNMADGDIYGFDEIHEHLSNPDYYDKFIMRYERVEKILEPELQSRLGKLYKTFLNLSSDAKWDGLYRKYVNAHFNLAAKGARLVKSATALLEDSLAKYFLEE